MGFSSTLAAPIMLAMAGTCPTPEPTMISVQPISERPIINAQLSTQELEGFDISTVSPYNHHEHTEVNGLMRGKAQIDTNVSVSWRTNPANGEACFWYKAINVELRLAPTVYIADHLIKGSCMYNEVLNHELKHVNVDRDLTNKYTKLFEQNIRNFTRQNFMASPRPAYQAEQVKNEMVDALDEEINRINNMMQEERIQRQAAIDTLQEYKRVATACIGKE